MALKNKEYLRILWEAEDGKDLVHKMQIKRPDVLLMDIRMPGGGWDQCYWSFKEGI